MNPQFIQVLIVSSLFLLALEWAKRRFGFNTDYTRKTAHIFYFFVIIYSYFHLTVHEAMTVLLIFWQYSQFPLFIISCRRFISKSIGLGGKLYILLLFFCCLLFLAKTICFYERCVCFGNFRSVKRFLQKKLLKKNLAYNTLYFITCLALLLSIALFYGRCETNYIFLAALAAALADRYSEFGLDNITVPLAVVLILA